MFYPSIDYCNIAVIGLSLKEYRHRLKEEEPYILQKEFALQWFWVIRMNSGDNSSDDDLGPSVPSGVLRSRGGWDDKFNLEIEHTKEKMNADNNNEDKKISAAVDLSQFRNEEVGKGYKAKHVVRQKEAISHATKVVDMSGGSTFNKQKEDRTADSSKSKKRRRDEESPVQSYLKCQGMRDFIKQTHKILQQR